MKKQLRLTLHFEVNIDETQIPTNGVNAPHRSGDDEIWRENDDRSRRLLKAVLSNKESFDHYLKHQIAVWFECDAASDLGPTGKVEDALRPAIALLSTDDQDYYAEASAEGVFMESVEEFLDCFSTVLEDTEWSEDRTEAVQRSKHANRRQKKK